MTALPTQINAAMLTGDALVGSFWGAFGIVIVFAAVVLIIVKFFIGEGRNMARGVGALVAVGAVAVLAANPAIVMDIGRFILSLGGIGN